MSTCILGVAYLQTFKPTLHGKFFFIKFKQDLAYAGVVGR